MRSAADLADVSAANRTRSVTHGSIFRLFPGKEERMLRSGSTLGAALAAVLLAGVARADEPEGARAVIDRALKATYEDKDLGKPVAVTCSAEGTYHGMGSAQPFTATYAV